MPTTGDANILATTARFMGARAKSMLQRYRKAMNIVEEAEAVDQPVVQARSAR